MTITFDRHKYASLLNQYLPKAIDSEEENRRAIALSSKLEHQIERTPEEEEFLKLLLILIDRFETEHYPIPQDSQLSMLIHLMEAREITSEELVPILGSRAIVDVVLAGTEKISHENSQLLANFFGVDAALFD